MALTPALTTTPHPLSPLGTTHEYTAFLPGETLGAYVARNQIVLPRSVFRVQHNGRAVPMALWSRLIPRPGDHVLIYAVAEGGDSGKVLRSVAMIALMITAHMVAGPLGASIATALNVSTQVGTAIATAAVMTAGTLLISAILPPPKPPDIGGGKYDSPTYTLTGGRNRMRQWEPMMIIFGRHKVMPDLASIPYSEWEDKDQYLNQIFHFGVQAGHLEISDLKVGDTLLSSFSGVQTEISGADGKLSLVSGNVATISGFDSKYNEENVRTTPAHTTKIIINLALMASFVKGNGETKSQKITYTIKYRPVGGSWISIDDEFSRDGFPKSTYKSYSYDVAEGAYEVSIKKTTIDKYGNEPDDDNDSIINLITVQQILCVQPDTNNYDGQQRVAVRIKASGQLQGALDEVSAIVTAKCPAWTGVDWTETATRNPAWWFLWFARGYADSVFGRICGPRYSESRIDFDSIKAWASFCQAKGLTFDYVLDRKIGSDEMLDLIARAGRASKTFQGGKLGVIWDAADMPISAVFGPYNVKAGTFKITYINGDSPDEIVGNFVNAETGYKLDSVRVSVPGTTTNENPLTLDMEGMTNRDRVAREINLIAAEQVWRRRQIEWETDIEGWTAHRGQVVRFTHDLTAWGTSGRLMARDGATITLSQKIPTGNGTMQLRDPEGNFIVAQVAGDTTETDTVTIVSALGDFPLPGDAGYEDCDVLDWAFDFDPLETPGRRFKITNVQPSGEFSVRFIAVDDDPEFYACETNPYDYTPPRDGAALAGIVLDIAYQEGRYNSLTGLVDVTVVWALSIDVPVDVQITVDGSMQPVVRSSARRIVVPGLRRGTEVLAMITPVSFSGRGRPMSSTYTVQGTALPPAALAWVHAIPEGARLRLSWATASDLDVVDYEVRDSDSGWGGANYEFLGDATTALVDPGAVGVSKTWYVRAVSAAGLYGKSSAFVTYTANAVPDVTDITHTFRDTSQTSATVTLSWAGVAPEFGLETYRVSYGTESIDVNATSITLPADWIGDRAFTIQTIDRVGQVSAGAVTSINKRIPAPPKNIRAQVIDNNVMLYWDNPAPTTLPVDHVMIRRGPDFGPAEEIGPKKGGFTTILELHGGLKTYWLSTVDTDGWESDPVAIAVTVAEPPDFVFNGQQASSFSGTLTNAAIYAGSLYLPVDTSQTWETHYTSHTFASPQAQVTAGYPYYLQPTESDGSYVEVFDFGATVPSSKVTASIDQSTVTGSSVVAVTIETSADGTSWSAPIVGMETFASSFRYVRLTIDVTQSSDTAIVRVAGITVTLSSKLRNDAGSVACVAGDTLGTVANFNADFLDIQSITLTPAGTTPLTAVYDYKDAILSGTYSRASGVVTVSVTAHGLAAGQDVMLNYANDDPERVTVTSAAADSFTATTGLADKTGDIQIYAQGMRVYLFDDTGTRASGAVSWAVKGY